MKVLINQVLHDSEKKPIILKLSKEEKKVIMNMKEDQNHVAFYSEDISETDLQKINNELDCLKSY